MTIRFTFTKMQATPDGQQWGDYDHKLVVNLKCLNREQWRDKSPIFPARLLELEREECEVVGTEGEEDVKDNSIPLDQKEFVESLAEFHRWTRKRHVFRVLGKEKIDHVFIAENKKEEPIAFVAPLVADK